MRKKAVLYLLLIIILSGIVIAARNDRWYRYPAPANKQFPVTPVDLTPGSKTGNKLAIVGAKNEYLNLYFRIKGADPATLKVFVKPKPAGQGAAFTFYQVRPAPFMAGSRFVLAPDALVPLEQGLAGIEPLDILATIKIPRTLAGGMHHHQVVFTDGKGSFTVPLELKVWNFSLPDDLPITIMGNLWGIPRWFTYYGVRSRAQFDQVIKDYLRSMRAYKFNSLGPKFYPFAAAKLTPGKKVEAEFPGYHKILTYALNELQYRSFCVPIIYAGRQGKRKFLDESQWLPKAKNFFPPFQDYLQRHGWASKGFNKLMDEPLLPYYPVVYDSYKLAQGLAPKLKTFCTGRAPDPRLAKVINVWAISARFYTQTSADAARAQGQEIWLYFNRLHKMFSPAASQRLIGWVLYRYKFSGYLFWALNHWQVNVWSPNIENVRIKLGGSFFYPNPQNGSPWPTTRLEATRRGLQDYQYLDLLDKAKAQGKIAPQAFAAIQQGLGNLVGPLEHGMEFKVTMPEMESLRLKIGELLDKAAVTP